jgi:hypothetical protein
MVLRPAPQDGFVFVWSAAVGNRYNMPSLRPVESSAASLNAAAVSDSGIHCFAVIGNLNTQSSPPAAS